MAKPLGNRSGRTTPAQARKEVILRRRREQRAATFIYSGNGRYDLFVDGRIAEHDLTEDDFGDALSRRRVPATANVYVEDADGARSVLRRR